MLSSRSLVLLALGSAIAVGGCTTKSTGTETPIDTSSNGAGGSDGTGGFDPIGSGAGGAGGSTGTGEGGTGEGGGLEGACGVEAACWGDEETGCAPSACGAAEIDFQCPATSEDTLAYQTCTVAAEIYRENVWGHVLDCLREAGADITAQCDEAEATVGACIEQGYVNACTNPTADTLCEDAATACADFDDDTFPLEQCQADLVVMNDTALNGYLDCFNDDTVEGTCADIHDICFVQITSL